MILFVDLVPKNIIFLYLRPTTLKNKNVLRELARKNSLREDCFKKTLFRKRPLIDHADVTSDNFPPQLLCTIRSSALAKTFENLRKVTPSVATVSLLLATRGVFIFIFLLVLPLALALLVFLLGFFLLLLFPARVIASVRVGLHHRHVILLHT